MCRTRFHSWSNFGVYLFLISFPTALGIESLHLLSLRDRVMLFLKIFTQTVSLISIRFPPVCFRSRCMGFHCLTNLSSADRSCPCHVIGTRQSSAEKSVPSWPGTLSAPSKRPCLKQVLPPYAEGSKPPWVRQTLAAQPCLRAAASRDAHPTPTSGAGAPAWLSWPSPHL